MINLSPKEFQTLIIKHSDAYVKTGKLLSLQRSVTLNSIVYIENKEKL